MMDPDKWDVWVGLTAAFAIGFSVAFVLCGG